MFCATLSNLCSFLCPVIYSARMSEIEALRNEPNLLDILETDLDSTTKTACYVSAFIGIAKTLQINIWMSENF